MIEKYRKRNEYFNIIDNLLDPIIVFKKKKVDSLPSLTTKQNFF